MVRLVGCGTARMSMPLITPDEERTDFNKSVKIALGFMLNSGDMLQERIGNNLENPYYKRDH